MKGAIIPSDALLGGLNVNRLLIPTTLSRFPEFRDEFVTPLDDSSVGHFRVLLAWLACAAGV
nr:hypothetical protein [Rhodoferax sp.]